MSFPERRLRRLRRTSALRDLMAETRLGVSDLVAPLFVRDGIDAPVPVASMPGVYQHTRESLRREVRVLADLGIPGLLLFGIPAVKDDEGSGAWDAEGVVPTAVREIRQEIGDAMVVMADLCLDEYTSHGHCGVLTTPSPGQGATESVVDNDATLELYSRVAVAQGAAGVDLVAPSGMMDGQVTAIRRALDQAGHPQVGVMAYAAKYASAAYGPFRDAVDVTIDGDRRAYQQDCRNFREALVEVDLDVAEGADIVMIKPAMTSLDVIAAVRSRVNLPVAAYHVSGEYSMVKAAAERGWLDGPAMALEQITAVKRAGADFVVTYFARELAEALHA